MINLKKIRNFMKKYLDISRNYVIFVIPFFDICFTIAKIMKNKHNYINFKQYPYRGIISEIATELNITRQTVHYGLNISPNPAIIKLLQKKIRVINRDLKTK